jgi:hypothetical protein
MGGAPSTGSSLLVNILNRHPEIMAGPETYLFIHPALYDQWEQQKKHLLKTGKLRGLKSIGWFRMNGADLLHDFYSWDRGSLSRTIKGSPSFPDFADQFFGKAADVHTRVWLEKSPSNTLAFDYFLSHFRDQRVIHTTRNPLDTIASLVSRGHNPFYAAGAYLINTAFALKVHSHPAYYLVRYEDLVHDPQTEVKALLRFLQLAEVEEKLWEPKENEQKEDIRMKGWMANEKGTISNKSLGRFEKLSDNQKILIRAAVASLQIASHYAKKHQLPYTRIDQIAAILDYPLPDLKPGYPLKPLKKWRRKDHWIRRIKRYPTRGRNYPLIFQNP